MKIIVLVYTYNDKNGKFGSGNIAFPCKKLPLSVVDFVQVKRKIEEETGFRNIVIINIIELNDGH